MTETVQPMSTASERIAFTTLPNGVNGATRNLSVWVAPRLTPVVGGATTLAQFPNWLDWPEQVRSVSQWTVTVSSFDVVELSARVTSPAPRSDLWQALFTAATPVGAWTVPDWKNYQVRSFPTAEIEGFLNSFYAEVGVGAEVDAGRDWSTFPNFKDLVLGKFDGFPLQRINQDGVREEPETELLGDIDSELRENRYNTHGTNAKNFVLLKRFHDRTPSSVPPEKLVPEFHEIVSLLGDHPHLLRLLGLVVDLEIDDPGTRAFPYVSVTPTWSPQVAPTALELTRTQYDPATFRPAFSPPSPGDEPEFAAGGWLRLGGPNFGVTRIDVDGSGLKLYEWARSTWWRLHHEFVPDGRSEHEPISSDGLEQAPPSLRSGGLSVFRKNRAKQTVVEFDRSAGLGTAFVLTGDVLTRGLRIDVWDSVAGRWFQLNARTVGASLGYRFWRSSITVVPPDDEGWIAAGAASDVSKPNELYQGESLFHWTGWSLSAVRPGQPFSVDPGQGPVSAPGNPSDSSAQFEVSYAAKPGTLPKLRFGRSYRFRARAVDLAGNSLPFTDAFDSAFAHMSPPVTHGRFEPVESPALVMRKARTEGESTEHLVIRSNFNTSDGSIATNERHVVAPMTSQEMCEQHGMIDTPSGALDKAKYAMLRDRDGKTFAGGGTVDANNYGARFYDRNVLTVPYLTDPVAQGAALHGLPGGAPVVKVPFYDAGATWPVSRAFRLVLKAGSAAPIPPSAANNYSLTVFVPKGRTRSFRLSSYLTAAGLGHMGHWHRFEEEGFAEIDSLRNAVLDGKLWLFNPYRTVRLTHAVRQPLWDPQFTSSGVVATRTFGSTDVALSFSVALDRPSTATLDLVAEWNDLFDLVDEAGPRTVRGKETAFSIDVDELGSPDTLDYPPASTSAAATTVPPSRHQLRDTKHRLVNYSLVATTRFMEYFATTRSITLPDTAPLVLDSRGVVPGTDSLRSLPAADGTSTPFVRGRDYTIDEATGSVRRRSSGAIPARTAIQARYVVPPVTRSSVEKPTGRQPVRIPSTARPAVPVVREVVPVFQWEGPSKGASGVRSARAGNTLRVYLERPWYSSGADEQLGVVIAPVRNSSDRVRQYITLCGRDPIFAPQGTVLEELEPQASVFPLATRFRTGLTLDELGDGTFVAVAGHDVTYDSARRLWYTDIQFALGDSYNPFVRLALARYQPYSVASADGTKNVHLSRVANVDVFPLSPNRTATVMFDPARADRITVAVTGITYRSDPTEHAAASVTVIVEEQLPGVTGDLGWRTTGAGRPLTAARVGNVTTWSDSLTLPAPRTSKRFRLVIREFEAYKSSSGFPDYRVVYLDTIEL
jgi:hypothetical protein